MATINRKWPAEGVTRVPYWVYSDQALYEREQERIFHGATWSFLCLEAELPQPNAFRTSTIGTMPVVVTRDGESVIHAFENRCAHRGSLLCLKERGEERRLTCVYHNWTYDLEGNLVGVAFRRGIGGQGGLPRECRPEEQAPRKLRTATLAGLVFGTLSSEVEPIETFLGPDLVRHIHRVMRAPVQVLGSYSQIIPSNWKLYIENVKDVYHASLLHTFFTTFRLNRLTQKGAILINESGGGHVSLSMAADTSGDEYEKAELRSARAMHLEAPELLHSVDEFGDGIGTQILAVFPNFVLQQIRNCLAVRRIVPLSLDRSELVWVVFGFVDDDDAMKDRRLRQANLVGPAGFISMEDGCAPGFVQRGAAAAADCLSVVEMGGSGMVSSESRVSEASVRGMWAAYRKLMKL